MQSKMNSGIIKTLLDLQSNLILKNQGSDCSQGPLHCTRSLNHRFSVPMPAAAAIVVREVDAILSRKMTRKALQSRIHKLCETQWKSLTVEKETCNEQEQATGSNSSPVFHVPKEEYIPLCTDNSQRAHNHFVTKLLGQGLSAKQVGKETGQKWQVYLPAQPWVIKSLQGDQRP